jgi:hypothetical protein
MMHINELQNVFTKADQIKVHGVLTFYGENVFLLPFILCLRHKETYCQKDLLTFIDFIHLFVLLTDV